MILFIEKIKCCGLIKPGEWGLIKMNEELTEHVSFNFNAM
jgi:hypothetical protein